MIYRGWMMPDTSWRVVFEALEWLGLDWDEAPVLHAGERGRGYFVAPTLLLCDQPLAAHFNDTEFRDIALGQ